MPKLKTLKIEWHHSKTVNPRIGKTLKEIVTHLKKKNIDIILAEKKISGAKQSEILLNDMPIEFILDEARVRENFCGTCSTPAERQKKSENYSAELIKKAALKAAGLT